MDDDLKDRFFEAAEESPGSWLLRGMSLRAAAARLDWRTTPVRDDENTMSFLAEYQMLLGMSFENLLKGIITLNRIEKSEKPFLHKECTNRHQLKVLAMRSELDELSLTDEDLSVLERLSMYIEWAGRYPIPKKVGGYEPICHGNREYEAELLLWERLAQPLLKQGWVMKGGPKRLGGYRLYLKQRDKKE